MQKQALNISNAQEELSTVSSPLISTPTLLKEYEKTRKISQRLLSEEIIKCLPKDAIPICGKKLGILEKKALMLNREGDLDIIMDYCLFHYYSGDKNAVDRYALIKGDKLADEERTVLLTMQKAEYALFSVEKTLPYGGCSCK